MISSWLGRPSEVRALLNPYFCGAMLYGAVKSYNDEGEHELPVELVFLILPLVLHKKTREVLPKKKNASIGLWVADNQLNLLSYSRRVISVNKYTLMALALLKDKGLISLSNGQISIQGNLKGLNSYCKVSAEVAEIFKQACFVGRWFSQSDRSSSIYAYLGVRP